MTMLRIELRRAFGNRWFIGSLAILVTVALVAAAGRVVLTAEKLDVVVYPYLDSTYWYLSSFSSFTSWIAVNHLDTPVELFFTVVPLLVLMGYSWSLASDVRSGYVEQLLVRTARARMYAARFCAVFLSGGALVAVPLACNFLALALFVPSWAPSMVDSFYTGVGDVANMADNALFTTLFYTDPVAFVLCRTLLDFALCGLWSTTVLALSLFVRNRVLLVVAPYVFLLFLKHLGQRLYVLMRTNGFDGFGRSVTLFDQLRATPDGFFCPGWLTLLCMFLMLGVSVGAPLLARNKDML
jgi:hypothetical protein